MLHKEKEERRKEKKKKKLLWNPMIRWRDAATPTDQNNQIESKPWHKSAEEVSSKAVLSTASVLYAKNKLERITSSLFKFLFNQCLYYE